MRRFTWARCAVVIVLSISVGLWSAWGGDDPLAANASVAPGLPADWGADDDEVDDFEFDDAMTDDEGVEDLTDSFAIETSAPRQLAAGMYAIDVRLKNKTKQAIDGPLFLVVEEVGVPGTSLRFRDINQLLRESIESDEDEAHEAKPKAEDAIAAPVAERVADRPVAVEILAGKNNDEAEDEADEAIVLPGYEPPFVVENCRGWTDWDEPYFVVLARGERVLPGRRVAPMVEVQVRALEPFTDEELAQLEIKVWVTRQEDPEAEFDDEEEAPELDEASQNALDAALEISKKHTDAIMAIEGVQGMGVGLGDARNLYGITVYVEGPGANLPREIEGLPVRVRIVGKIRPFWSAVEVDAHAVARNPRRWFPRPAPTGISIGTLMGSFGVSGTLGCRVRRNGLPHIMTNNHVLVPQCLNDGRNWNCAHRWVYQPGLADAVRKNANIVGNLNVFVPRYTDRNNRMDVALARTVVGDIGISTQTGTGQYKGYGAHRRRYSKAYPDLQVMKYGRTTALTHGKIDAIGMTIVQADGSVRYTFVNQIGIVGNDVWGQSGDSGSLVVTKRGRNPVGLFHSGSSGGKFGVAAPIKPILDLLEAKIEGSTLAGRPAGKKTIKIEREVAQGARRTHDKLYQVPSGKRLFRWEWQPTRMIGVSNFRITKSNSRTVRMRATIVGPGILKGKLILYYE